MALHLPTGPLKPCSGLQPALRHRGRLNMFSSVQLGFLTCTFRESYHGLEPVPGSEPSTYQRFSRCDRVLCCDLSMGFRPNAGVGNRALYLKNIYH